MHNDKLEQQAELQAQVNQALDKDIANLDGFTEARIQAARLNALANANQHWWQKLTLPQGLAASALSVAAVVAIVNPLQSENPANGIISEEQLMASLNPVLVEDPEMLEQLEFVAWLEQEAVLDEDGQS